MKDLWECWVSEKHRKNSQRKARMWQVFVLYYSYICRNLLDLALRCRNDYAFARCFSLRLRSLICTYAHIWRTLREINIRNAGLNALKVDHCSHLAQTLGLHFCISVSKPSRIFFLNSVLGQHLCSHSSSINPVCWGSSPSPPLFSSSSSSSSPCFSTHSCLSNGPHLGEIEPLSVRLQKRNQRAKGVPSFASRSACAGDIPLGWRQPDTSL